MRRWKYTYVTLVSVSVTVTADDEDAAADLSWQRAEEYLDTVIGDHQGVTAYASLDGIGADEVEEIAP